MIVEDYGKLRVENCLRNKEKGRIGEPCNYNCIIIAISQLEPIQSIRFLTVGVMEGRSPVQNS